MPMHDMLKRKNYAKNMKSKKNQNDFNMVASMFLRDVRVI